MCPLPRSGEVVADPMDREAEGAASSRQSSLPPPGCLVAVLSNAFPHNVSSPTKWGRCPAAIAAGRRGLPEKGSRKAELLSVAPSVRLRRAAPLNIERPVSPTGEARPGLSMLTRKRESTRERESSTPNRVALSRNATPDRGTDPYQVPLAGCHGPHWISIPPTRGTICT